MRRVLDMMASALAATWDALVALNGNDLIGPVVGVLLLLAALVVLVSLIPRRGERLSQRPDVLISKGEISFREGDGALVLSLTVSNLNLYPLQLLELSVNLDDLPAPLTTEVAALVAPQGTVELTAELEDARGDEGTLELYLYTTETRRKTHRLVAKFLWEPWNGRYKISQLGQKVIPVRALASTRHHRRQLASWRRQLSVSHAPDGNPILADELSSVDLPPDNATPNGEAAAARRSRPAAGKRDTRDSAEEEPGDSRVPLDFPRDF